MDIAHNVICTHYDLRVDENFVWNFIKHFIIQLMH